MTDRHYLTREDFVTWLTPVSEAAKPAAPKRPFLTWTGLVGSALVVATLNLPVLWSLSRSTAPLPELAPVLAATTVELGSVPAEAPAETAEAPQPQPAADRVTISALGVDTPVIWQSDYNSKTILKNLRDGVVHLKGTALPGQKGLSVITGHSSYYLWAAGSYKDVFAPLLKAQIGQEIKVARAGTAYTYQITEVYEVEPSRTDLLVSGDETKLRLITCSPLGTSLRRLIVDAKQISPDPNQNETFSGPKLSAETIIGNR